MLIVHRTVSRFRTAALLHASIVSRLAVTILSAPTIALNAVGLALCIMRCPASQRGRSSVRAAMRSGHCQLAGAISRATRPGTIAHAKMPEITVTLHLFLLRRKSRA
jgi:hypothetical protein